MADFTLGAGPFPAGTTVGVYARRTVFREVSGPIGAAITTGTTASNRTTAFTGLAYDTDYWAAASISGAWHKVAFSTEADPASVALTLEDLAVLQELVADEATARANAITAVRASLSVNVKAPPYNATGDGVADDTAEVAAAIAAAGVSGGEVYFPAGIYKMSATITVPDRVTLRGAGVGASSLVWSTDLGIGVYAVAAGTGGQHLAQQYRELALLGPRAEFAPTYGTRSCLMDGVQATSWAHMDECFVSGFGGNIVLTGDHQKFRGTRSTRGYFNWLYGDNTGVGTSGDQEIDGCTADFAAWANVGCHGNNNIQDNHWTSLHFGFAPYGIYKFDALHPTTGVPGTAAALGGGAVASTTGLLLASSLDKVQFEEQGNACIHDDSTGAGAGSNTLLGTTINLPFHSFNNTYKIASRVQDYAIHARVSRASLIRQGITGFVAGAIAAIHIVTGGIRVEGDPFAGLFSPTSSTVEGLLVSNTFGQGRGYVSAGTVAAGDILEKDLGGYTVVRYALASAGRPILGVALHACTAGQIVAVQTEGTALVLCETVALGGLYIVPGGGGVAHRGQAVLGWGVNSAHAPTPDPAFAVSMTSGGAGGGALLLCALLGPGGKDETGFIRPQLVSALPAAAAAYRGVMLRLEPGGASPDTLHLCEHTGSGTFAWRAL